MMKKKKINKNNILFQIGFVFVIMFFLMFGMSISTFMIGFHNDDLGQNVRYLNTEFNLDLVDLSSSRITYEYSEMILRGNSQMMCGLISSILSAMGFVMALYNMLGHFKGGIKYENKRRIK